MCVCHKFCYPSLKSLHTLICVGVILYISLETCILLSSNTFRFFRSITFGYYFIIVETSSLGRPASCTSVERFKYKFSTCTVLLRLFFLQTDYFLLPYLMYTHFGEEGRSSLHLYKHVRHADWLLEVLQTTFP